MLEIHNPGEISASVSDRIPPELFYDIFRLLSDDKDALASCACVSRYWRSVSLPWLFFQVTVPEAKSFASFVDYFDTYPDLGTHIKTLRLIGNPSPHPQSHRQWTPLSVSPPSSFLISKLGRARANFPRSRWPHELSACAFPHDTCTCTVKHLYSICKYINPTPC